ncbi:MAG: hypothetical protein HND47_22470 [Chloroflexi bacterium]|nr:hypothetical protein [Chloroflexota bacterium]
MRKILPILAGGILFIYGCGATPITATPSAEVAMTLFVLTPTPPPTPSPTPEPTPEAPPEFFRGIAPTLAEFTKIGSVQEIFDTIIPYLRATEPKFADDVTPVDVQLVKDAQGNPERVILVCNEGGAVNCVPVASVQVDGKYVLILKIKNADGSNGFFPWFIAGYHPERIALDKNFSIMIDNPKMAMRLVIPLSLGSMNPNDYPVIDRLVKDKRYQEAMREFQETDIYPENYEEIIPAANIPTSN